MSRSTRNRLFSSLLVFGLVAGILAFPAPPAAGAATCCEVCNQNYQECLRRTGPWEPICHGIKPCCPHVYMECAGGCGVWFC